MLFIVGIMSECFNLSHPSSNHPSPQLTSDFFDISVVYLCLICYFRDFRNRDRPPLSLYFVYDDSYFAVSTSLGVDRTTQWDKSETLLVVPQCESEGAGVRLLLVRILYIYMYFM